MDESVSMTMFDKIVAFGEKSLKFKIGRIIYRLSYPVYLNLLSRKYRELSILKHADPLIEVSVNEHISFSMQLDLVSNNNKVSHDLIFLRDLQRNGMYEPIVTKTLVKFIKEGTSFVDAGANNGYFSFLASKLIGQHGRVFSFEPNPDVFRRLTKNVQLNNLTNVQTYNLALDESESKSYLDTNYPEDGLSSMVTWRRQPIKGKSKSNGIISVTSIPLDNILKDTKDIVVKIDVEGAELNVLKGASNLIRNAKRLIILMEYRAYYTNASLIKFIFMFFDIYKIDFEDHDLHFVPLTSEKLKKSHAITILLCKKFNDVNCCF